MLLATQPSYDELRHAVGVCFTLGSPLRIFNVLCTQSIRCSIVLEQKQMYFVSLINYRASLETQRLNIAGS